MGKITVGHPLANGLFGKTRQGVLALLYGQPDSSFYTKQVMDAVNIGRGTVQRELKYLTDAGIIIREVQGRQVYYRANARCPIFTELRSIVRKTFGVANVLRSALAPIAAGINVAFIFGSVASGAERKASDIDLMVIGKASFGKVVDVISPAQEQLGREINAVVYSIVEFKKRAQEKHHFVEDVLRGDKIFLVGNTDELARLVGQRAAENAPSDRQ